MRLLTLIVIGLLFIGQAWSQEPFTGQITGAVVTGVQTGEPLQGVTVRVETHGRLIPGGETDDAGRFKIDLPTLIPGWRAEDETRLAVSFAKPEYEEVIWVLDCHVAGQSACNGLDVVLEALPDSRRLTTEVSINPDEIEVLDEHYQSSGLTLYLLPLSASVALGNELSTLMLESLQGTITNHLQTLPVVPPPRDITPPPDVELVRLNGLQVALTDTGKIQIYGRYLKTLAMINSAVRLQRDANGVEVAQLTFHYRAIPFDMASTPIREVYSYTVPVAELHFPERYEQMGARWGLYTLAALCIRELSAFKAAASPSDRTQLERVRAYLLAERAQLRRDEPLKLQVIEELLDLVNQHLGQEGGIRTLTQQFENRPTQPGSTR
jgi:hypothetical protein